MPNEILPTKLTGSSLKKCRKNQIDVCLNVCIASNFIRFMCVCLLIIA